MGVLKAKVGGVWTPIGQGFGVSSPGFVGYDITGSSIGIPSASIDIGARVTWIADPTHRYKTTLFCGRVDAGGTKANLAVELTSAAGGGTIMLSRSWTITPGDSFVPMMHLVETGLSGTITRNARVWATTAGGTVMAGTFVLVEDITAATPLGLGTPWASFTPVMRGNNVANVLGSGGSTGGRFKVLGGTACHFHLNWTFGSSGAVAQTGQQTFDLPLPNIGPWGAWLGSGVILQGTTLYHVQVIAVDNTRLRMSVAPSGDVTNTSPAGITFGNSYVLGGVYEVAA